MAKKNDELLTVIVATVAMIAGILLGVWTQQGDIEDAHNEGYATGWEDGNNEGYFEGYDLGYEDGVFDLAEDSLTDFMNGFDEGWNAAVDSIYY
jgi:hypothetical protein